MVGTFCWRGQSLQVQGAFRTVIRMQAQRKGPLLPGTPGARSPVLTPRVHGVADMTGVVSRGPVWWGRVWQACCGTL